jgi:hypothetical protein
MEREIRTMSTPIPVELYNELPWVAGEWTQGKAGMEFYILAAFKFKGDAEAWAGLSSLRVAEAAMVKEVQSLAQDLGTTLSEFQQAIKQRTD